MYLIWNLNAINQYYENIATALHQATSIAVPHNCLKSYWNEELDNLKMIPFFSIICGLRLEDRTSLVCKNTMQFSQDFYETILVGKFPSRLVKNVWDFWEEII